MPSHLQDLEAEQFKRAIDGCPVALSWLLLRYRPRLEGYVRALLPADLRTTTDAEDLVQVVYLEAAQQIGSFKPTGDDSFFAWLATIARRRSIDAIRKHRAAKRGNNVTYSPSFIGRGDESVVSLLEQLFAHRETPSGVMASREAVNALDHAIAELPPDHQTVVRMYHLDQRPLREVAEILGRTEAATQKLAQRVLQSLRVIMGRRSNFM